MKSTVVESINTGTNQMKTKKQIRNEILVKRDALSKEERKCGDVLVTERVLGHQWYYGASDILLFLSFGSEIDTENILQESWRKGKRVYVPKVEISPSSHAKEIYFYQIESMQDVEKGFRGIREPLGVTEAFQFEPEQAKSMLILMPGVAFDKYGNRLGYGGGFYDRFLVDKPNFPSIAIGYRCQLVEKLPAESYDVRPNQVICL